MTSAPHPLRRRHVVSLVLIVAVVLLATVFSGWLLWAARSADQVTTGWTLDCPGTKVGSYRGHPAIHSRPGWRCTVQLRVDNRSGRSVRVTEVLTPMLGSGGGAEVQGFSTTDAEIRDVDPRFPDVDAVYDVDRTIPAGRFRTVELAIGWRESGCNSAGHFWITRWPTVIVEVLGRSHQVSANQRLVLRMFDDPHDQRACPR